MRKLFSIEKRRVFHKLTFRKVYNILLVYGSFYLSRLTNKTFHPAKPITISIEPTTACNLRCPECPSGLRSFSRPTGNLKMDFFRRIIDEMRNNLVYLIFYFQGEPYINPNFLEMVNHANKNKIYTITSTNGHFLNDKNARKTIESGLDKLIISIDGTTQETYASYRIDGRLDTVLQGARNVVKWKKKLNKSHPFISFQFLVVKPNEHQIEEVKMLAKEIGVDEVKFKTAQIYDFKHGNSLIPTISKYSRYQLVEDGTYKIKNELLNHCWKMWNSCVITWDGKVVPCCFDKNAKYEMGNLQNNSFSDIWNNTIYKEFRKKLFLGRNRIDICNNCTEGCKVYA